MGSKVDKDKGNTIAIALIPKHNYNRTVYKIDSGLEEQLLLPLLKLHISIRFVMCKQFYNSFCYIYVRFLNETCLLYVFDKQQQNKFYDYCKKSLLYAR